MLPIRALVVFALTAGVAFAQGGAEAVCPELTVLADVTGMKTTPKSVQVSLWQDGKMVKSWDCIPYDSADSMQKKWTNLTTGKYEIHFEAVGATRVVKTVILDGDKHKYVGEMKAGEGTVSLGGPDLKQLEARLKKLEDGLKK